MKVAILGATQGMGRALARCMADRGESLFLLGRDVEDLERSARDLEVRGAAGEVGFAVCDLARSATFTPALDAAAACLGGLEVVVVTAADFATQEVLEADSDRAESLLNVNFTGTVLFCEAARKRLLAAADGGSPAGTSGTTPSRKVLCVFSSVAGDRGRKPVAIYGAAKAGLSHYLESLDHKFRSRGLVTVCVKPGFVKTGMTAGLAPPPFAGEPEPVARRVLQAIDRAEPLVYSPAIWRWIMWVIRCLPRFVMRRIGF